MHSVNARSRVSSLRPGGSAFTGGRNVRESLRRLRGDGILADPETNGSVRRQGEHNIGRVVCQGATVPLCESEHRRCTDFVGEDVGEKAMGNFLSICPWIFGGSVGSNDGGNFFRDGRSVSGEIIGGTPGIEAIAEIFVELGE